MTVNIQIRGKSKINKKYFRRLSLAWYFNFLLCSLVYIFRVVFFFSRVNVVIIHTARKHRFQQEQYLH